MLHRNKMCNILHKSSQKEPNQLKGNIMFDFTKQTKQYEELAERLKEVNEFWINSVLSSFKSFYSVKK